jgi:hypothetical protein
LTNSLNIGDSAPDAADETDIMSISDNEPSALAIVLCMAFSCSIDIEANAISRCHRNWLS